VSAAPVGPDTGDQLSPSPADRAAVEHAGVNPSPDRGFPYAGLLELVRDLIEYTYRDWG
jgi:hypothetical protein